MTIKSEKKMKNSQSLWDDLMFLFEKKNYEKINLNKAVMLLFRKAFFAIRILWKISISRTKKFWIFHEGMSSNRGKIQQIQLEYLFPRTKTDDENSDALFFQNEVRLQAIIDASLNSVIEIDMDGTIISWNGRAEANFGWTKENALGRSIYETIIPNQYKDSHRKGLARYVSLSEETLLNRTFEISALRKNGEEIPAELVIVPIEIGIEIRFILFITDITKRKQMEEHRDLLALIDPLTKMTNRRLFLDRLDHAMAINRRHSNYYVVMSVNIDNFKPINEVYGRAMGDLLLIEAAKRLRDCLRAEDTISRFEGDEFALLLGSPYENELEAVIGANIVGEKILSVLADPYVLSLRKENKTVLEIEYSCSASIGVVTFVDQRDSKKDILSWANSAMYQAKAEGKNTIRFFNPNTQSKILAQTILEIELREAIFKEQFVLFYQPQMDRNNRIIGVEALLRWEHPKRGNLLPGEFIPLAEASNLILPIGQMVIESACKQLLKWASIPLLANLSIAVNVSVRQFQQSNFVEMISTILKQTLANPNQLKLELTESLFIDDIEETVIKMNMLRGKGILFSLDDFGTGYASLAQLKYLPLHQIKIDKAFVKNIANDPKDAAIANMVIALAEKMGLEVIAEGVEHVAQAEFLTNLGCHAYQGYFFCRPLTLADFEIFALTLGLA